MTWRLIEADCIEAMQQMDASSIDAIVTDPPYGLEFMGKEWDRLGDDAVSKSWDTRGRRDNVPSRSPDDAGGRHGVHYKRQNPRCRKCGRAIQGRDTAKGFKVCGCTNPEPYLPGVFPQRMQDWHHAWAIEALRVLKPGGHLLAFGGTRTYHRLACAVEDAGFEIRDCLAYMYGSGFPKSHNLDRLRDSPFCRCWEGESNDGDGDLRGVREGVRDTSGVDQAGEGTPLQSSVQRPRPVPRTRQALRRRSSGVDRDQLGFLSGEDDGSEQSSVEGRRDAQAPEGELQGRAVRASADVGAADGTQGRLHHGAPAGHGADGGTPPDPDGGREPHRPQPVEQRAEQPGTVADEPRSQAGGVWPVCERCSKPRLPRGLGTALKPAFEPIVLARKPLIGTVASNVTTFGTGALNIDGTRIATEGEEFAVPQSDPRKRTGAVGTDLGISDASVEDFQAAQRASIERTASLGRWPANVVLDEAAAALLDEQTGERPSRGFYTKSQELPEVPWGPFSGITGKATGSTGRENIYAGETGGASRFFYVAKSASAERNRGLEHRRAAGTTDEGYGSIQTPSLDRATPRENWKPHEVRNTHPTVKPVELMQWLCRLVTPPGGVVLDLFTGSGSTGIAALREGFSFIGIEREAEYVAIARDRIIGDAPLFNVSTEVT